MKAASGLIVAVAVAGSFAIGAGVSPGPDTARSLDKSQKENAFTWSDGLIRYSTIINCVSIIQGFPYTEYGAGTYVGFYADASISRPAPNIPYYVHVVVAGLGNACSGMRAYIDIALPPNTSLAVNATNKIAYYFDNVLLGANESPQTLSTSSYNPGAYAILSVDAANSYTWPIPMGRTIEIQIPVVSSTPLTNATFQANVWMLDGNDSPWLRPQAGIYVFSSTPVIMYPTPSTISISQTSGRSLATLFTNGVGGTGYFDLGTTASYGLIRDPVTIPSSGVSWEVWDEWGPPALQPGTTYHWRFSFTTSGGQTYYGTDQTFTTAADPTAVAPQASRAGAVSRPRASRLIDISGRVINSTPNSGMHTASGSGVLIRRDANGAKAIIVR